MKSCYTCKHRHSHEEVESWEMPHIHWWEHSCDARPSVANLKQFPFSTTTCPEWAGAGRATAQNIEELLS